MSDIFDTTPVAEAIEESEWLIRFGELLPGMSRLEDDT